MDKHYAVKLDKSLAVMKISRKEHQRIKGVQKTVEPS